MSARRPCLGPGGSTRCPTASIAPAGRRRCPRCTRAAEITRDLSPARAVYRTSRWRALSQQLRADHPWCVKCGSTEDLTVDHIIPLQHGGEPYAISNLQVLCRADQNRKHDQQ